MKTLSGVFTALITPFTASGKLDEEGFQALIERQIVQGIEGIAILGTTGETPTLSHDEKLRCIVKAREACITKCHLMVGTGTNATDSTITNTKEALENGADSALVITPYYNKPSQNGIIKHFQALCAAVDIPIVLYNHPGRSGTFLTIDTIKRLAEIPTIVGIKEATADINHAIDLIETLKKQRPDFSILSGNDPMTLSIVAHGGDGAVSVASNLFPKQYSAFVRSALNGELEIARQQYSSLHPLFKTLELESNPIMIKAAMSLADLPSGSPRLPLTPADEQSLAALRNCVNFETVDTPLTGASS